MTSEAQEVFVIFDGPPGPDAPRFVEVETPEGQGVSVQWHDRGDGTWALGPIVTIPALKVVES